MSNEPDDFMPKLRAVLAALAEKGPEGKEAVEGITRHIQFVSEMTESDAAALAGFVTGAHARITADWRDLAGRGLALVAVEYAKFILGRDGVIRPGTVAR